MNDHSIDPRRPHATAAKGRVLLVDDEDPLRRAYARTLEAAGFEVVQAESAASGLAAATRGVDVVFTDITMPGMSGIELLRLVRASDLDVPVVIVTGNPSVASAAEAMEHGALRYLLKPVAASVLVETAERAAKLRRIARLKREAASYLGADDKLVDDRAGLEASLGRALETLWMAFQPIVDYGAHTVSAYEALVRSREPSLPHPGALFSAAERLGRVHEVGRAIRSSVARTLTENPVHSDIFINLHSTDLLDESLFAADAPLTRFARRVVLEITERVALSHAADVPARIIRLRELGFRIAIDDLGAGYAGLSYFALLTPDVVKLDITLVRDVHKHPVKQKLIGSLASLCKELGMVVVAEGIETGDEREMVRQLGSDLMQGYLFAKPGPAYPDVAW